MINALKYQFRWCHRKAGILILYPSLYWFGCMKDLLSKTQSSIEGPVEGPISGEGSFFFTEGISRSIRMGRWR